MTIDDLTNATKAAVTHMSLNTDSGEAMAAIEYLKRKHQLSHQNGGFDKAWRFYLSDDERCSCGSAIRNPSRAHSYPEMVHGRTIRHVAELDNQ